MNGRFFSPTEAGRPKRVPWKIRRPPRYRPSFKRPGTRPTPIPSFIYTRVRSHRSLGSLSSLAFGFTKTPDRFTRTNLPFSRTYLVLLQPSTNGQCSRRENKEEPSPKPALVPKPTTNVSISLLFHLFKLSICFSFLFFLPYY
jgi:hypothetical protein